MAASKKTATKLTVEKKATVISKATHEKVVAASKKALAGKDVTIQDKEREVSRLQEEIEKLKAKPVVQKVETAGNDIGTTEKGWLRWISKNVLASILIFVVVAATIWILVLHGQRNGLQTKFDNCQRSKSEVQTKAASDSAKKNVTDLRSETSKIGETPTPEVKKNGTK